MLQTWDIGRNRLLNGCMSHTVAYMVWMLANAFYYSSCVTSFYICKAARQWCHTINKYCFTTSLMLQTWDICQNPYLNGCMSHAFAWVRQTSIYFCLHIIFIPCLFLLQANKWWRVKLLAIYCSFQQWWINLYACD